MIPRAGRDLVPSGAAREEVEPPQPKSGKSTVFSIKLLARVPHLVGVYESNAQRITCQVEERLAASGYLALVKPNVSELKGDDITNPETVAPVVV